MKQRFERERTLELEQLLNDISENMPMVRWSKQDLIDAIQLCRDDRDHVWNKYMDMRFKIMALITKDILADK